MTQKTPRNIVTTTSTQTAQPVRMAAKLLRAIDQVALHGKTNRDAAKIVGMNESALCRALRREAPKALLEERKALAALEADSLMGIAKTIAVSTGIELMQSAKSEQVRARMVEFFRGETRQPVVNVQVNNAAPHGYTYTRPDSQSGVDKVQDAVIIGQSPSVEP